ncbi:hypothetical protein D3C73_945080 [compost metagenome]
MAHQHQKDRVVARGQRAALFIQHAQGLAHVEIRQGQQAAPRHQTDQNRQRGAGHVEIRPDTEITVFRLHAHALRHGCGIAQHIGVAEHDALGERSRARGVLDQEHIIACDGVQGCVKAVRVGTIRAFDKFRPRGRARQTAITQHHHLVQYRQRRAGQTLS